MSLCESMGSGASLRIAQAPYRYDTKFVAQYFGVSPETVKAWRKRGVGPEYARIGGSVRYSAASLVEFAERGRTAA